MNILVTGAILVIILFMITTIGKKINESFMLDFPFKRERRLKEGLTQFGF